MASAEKSTAQSTTVLLSSNALAQREGIGQYISLVEGVEVIRNCALDDTVRYARGLQPSVAVICLSMTDELNSSFVVKLTKDASEFTQVVLFGFAMGAPLIQSAVRAGAAGCVSGDADGMSPLVEAIRAVAAGGSYMSQGVANTFAWDDGPELTERELEVCRLVALGYSTRETAAELGLSTRTVESYRSRLNTKLGVKSRRELVAFALRKRLIP